MPLSKETAKAKSRVSGEKSTKRNALLAAWLPTSRCKNLQMKDLAALVKRSVRAGWKG